MGFHVESAWAFLARARAILENIPIKSLPGLVYLIAIAFGFFFRIHQINSRSFWLDEAYSWTMATRFTFSEILERTAGDFHPPAYFLALKCWIIVFGQSEAAQRALSVVFDLLTMPLLYLLCCEAVVHRPGSVTGTGMTANSGGLLATALYAASGVHIHWSSEVRMYSMATCFTVASSWLLLRSISGMALKSWIAYTISATLLLYTHNYSVFVICGQMFFLAADLRRAWKAETKNSHRVGQQRNMRLDRSLYSSMVVFLVVFLSFAPWLIVLLRQVRQAQSGYWISKMDWLTVSRTWLSLLIHENTRPETRDQILAVMVSMISIAVIICFRWYSKNQGGTLVLTMIASPLLGSSVVSCLFLPIIAPRHYLATMAFFFCVLAYVIHTLLPRGLATIFATWLLINFFYLNHRFVDDLRISEDSGAKAAVECIASQIQDSDSIAVANQEMLLSTRYYAFRLLGISQLDRGRAPKLFESIALVSWLGSAVIDKRDQISASEISEAVSRRIWVVGATGDTPRSLGDLSAADWELKATFAFNQNFYFEREIRLWLFARREP